MRDFITLHQVHLTNEHVPTGVTRHYRDRVEIPVPTELRIIKYADVEGYYLLYFHNGAELTDTYHDTLEAAMLQAQREFGVERTEWIQQ